MRMLTAAFSLLCALLLPAYACAQEGSAHTILVASDTHFISPALTDNGAYFTRMVERSDGKVTLYCDALTDAFCAQVIAQQPDCLILSGDLTFNGARRSHEDFAQKLARIQEAGIPVYVIPGNHDLYSGAAALEGVPSVLLSGDKALCDESKELVPGLFTVYTKEARGVTVLTKTPAEVRDELRAAAEQAVKNRASIALPKLADHYEVEINLKDHTHAYRASFFPGMEQKDAQTVVYRTDKLFDVLRMLRFVL